MPALPGDEPLLQSLPAFEVLMLQYPGVHREWGRPHNELRFKHEGQCVAEILRLQVRVAGALKRIRIGTMAGHAVVQAGATRDEAFSFCIVSAEYQAHEFVHQIAMKPRRSKGVLGNHPPRRKDREIAVRRARKLRWRTQHGIDGGIRMVE